MFSRKENESNRHRATHSLTSKVVMDDAGVAVARQSHLQSPKLKLILKQAGLEQAYPGGARVKEFVVDSVMKRRACGVMPGPRY